MGTTLSSLTDGSNGNDVGIGPGLGDIPESCVARVFLYLTPPEISNLARLNRALRGADTSDSVWDKKLPSNYQDLLDLLPPERYRNLSKKDIFALLGHIRSRSTMAEVWVDRESARVCLSISARALAITGIDDRRYWNWVPIEESRYGGLKLTRQLNFPFLLISIRYPLRLHVGRFFKRLGRRVYNFGHTHGWDITPVKFELSTSDGQQGSSAYCLDETEQDELNRNHKCGY